MPKAIRMARHARSDARAFPRDRAATDVPVNADFEGGYADDPDEVAENVKLCIATGVAGISIEDFTEDRRQPSLRFRSRWHA